MRDLHRTLSGVPSCALESSHAGWVWVAVLSSTNEFGRTLISICAPRDVCVATVGYGHLDSSRKINMISYYYHYVIHLSW